MKRLLLFLAVSVLLFACRKQEWQPNSSKEIVEKFLKIPAAADDEIKSIVANLKSAEIRSGFLIEFAQKNGFPVWNKMVKGRSTGHLMQSNSFESGHVSKMDAQSSLDSDRAFYLIPMADPNTREVKGYMACERINDTTFIFKSYNKNEILSTSALDNRQKKAAKPLLSLFAYFEQEINGKEASNYQLGDQDFHFRNVRLLVKSPSLNTATQSSTSEAGMVIPSCKREIIGEFWIDYGDGTFEYILVLSSCLTLPGVAVSTTIPQVGSGGGGGGFWGYTGQVDATPVASGMPGVGGGSGGTSTYPGGSNPGYYGNPWDVFWVSNVSNMIPASVESLTTMLGLTTAQSTWLLENVDLADELFAYVTGAQGRTERAIHHLIYMMTDIDYYSFVSVYHENHPYEGIWFLNADWLDNPVNINFDLDSDTPYEEFKKKLNTEEKILTAMYPLAAYRGYQNAKKAQAMTIAVMGNNGLNDKSDAFRHAFFSAINERDMGKDPIIIGTSIARLFGEAHETTTPPELILEKTMDLFNNDVGYSIGNVIFSSPSDESIKNSVLDKLNAGYLRYLNPLNPAYFHGITPYTVLTPTDM